ncbi:hypothetical protein C491_07766 [Natronococcus amylolyticus DSM 10524]|uniref:DUF7978 domain-containing protein n=1 Tax=Natronococcus amylolyticus DSM 10524 TaxID=1227497 RepID=L9XCP9_9EURY|nr:hypothetical protein [Natronococcus amylolyticus]ELY59221.1 hypothetical protein C491_07766 [Natronococcus amylolyticus DSM 10524]
MSTERRLEYDKGPSLEDEPGDDDPNDGDDPERTAERSGRPTVEAPAWAVGVASGVIAFAAVFLMSHQLAGSMFGTGLFTQVENEPSRWMMSSFTMLGSHGAVIVEGEEAAHGLYAPMGMFASHVSALVPPLVLGVVGYLLARYVRLETLSDAGILVGTLTATYVVPLVALGTATQWVPEESDPAAGEVGAEQEVLSIAVDVSMVVSTTLSVALFVSLGAAVAVLPRLLERAPIETTIEDGSA